MGRSLAHDVEHEPGGDSRDDAAAAISQRLTRPDGEIRASRVIGAGDRGRERRSGCNPGLSGPVRLLVSAKRQEVQAHLNMQPGFTGRALKGLRSVNPSGP
jgi:hypothetical protein